MFELTDIFCKETLLVVTTPKIKDAFFCLGIVEGYFIYFGFYYTATAELLLPSVTGVGVSG
jgi:hypothetical protein